jgi:hypothetical protein
MLNSTVFSRSGLSYHAERFFGHVSRRRDRYATWLGRKDQGSGSTGDDLGFRWDGDA